MKIKTKLKRTRRSSLVAIVIALLSFGYLLVTIAKGLYQWTEGSTFGLAININNATIQIFQATNFFPLDFVWRHAPAIPFEENDVLLFYKIIAPPAIIILICALFIFEHRATKVKYRNLKAEIEKEVALRDLRREAGIQEVAEGATVDIIVSNATNSDPLWHDTWWGKVAIGISIILVAAAFGIN